MRRLQGVTATWVKDLSTGATRLQRIRFSRVMFSPESAAQWYERNRQRIGLASASAAASVADSTTPSKASMGAGSSATPVAGRPVSPNGGGAGLLGRRAHVSHGR